MIYPDGWTAEEWADEWDIPLKSEQCMGCKKYLTPSIPFALKGYRGLLTADHGCPKTYNRSICRPIGEELKKWKEILG